MGRGKTPMRSPLSSEAKSFLKALGERLAAFRRRRGLTQVELAKLLGCSQQQIVSFECGRRRIQVTELPQMSKVLGASVEELLGIREKSAKRGPPSQLEQQLERLSKLPRSKQRVVSEMLEGFLQRAGQAA